MPQTTTSRLQKGYSILFLLFPFLAMAQEEFSDDTDDITPAASIDNYIPLVLVLVIYFAYHFFKPYRSIKTKN
jgi:Sec-independent protein secretion pathway component TatC